MFTVSPEPTLNLQLTSSMSFMSIPGETQQPTIEGKEQGDGLSTNNTDRNNNGISPSGIAAIASIASILVVLAVLVFILALGIVIYRRWKVNQVKKALLQMHPAHLAIGTSKVVLESIFQTNFAYGIDITNPATETGTSAELSLTNHTEHDSQDMAVDVVPNEAYGAISANTQMPVCSTDKGRGESVYQTNVAYGITKPAIETSFSALINHTEHDSQDMAVVVAPNEAYGAISANTQIHVCTIDKGCDETVYQTNVAYGIIRPALETGTSAEFSLTHHTEHDSQDMAVDVAPNEAYGVTPAGAQMTVCTTDRGCSSKHKVCSSALTNTSLHENDGTEYSYVHCEQQP